MRKKSVIAMLLLLAMGLAACAPVASNDGTIGSAPSAPPTEGTELPATEPPATEAPATEPPATEPPATEAPATEPPATEPPATEPPATEPPVTEPPATEPEPEKEIRSILLIGNSSCYYWCDELYAMAKAEGIELVVANLYISGCNLKKHWDNYNSGTAYTSYIIHDSNGKTTKKDITLEMALNERQWDAISLQQSYGSFVGSSLAAASAATNNYAKQLYDLIKQKQPNAKLFWQQTWTFQVGHSKIKTVQAQTAYHELIKASSQSVCGENQVNIVPVSDAWQLARADDRIGQTLCIKNSSGNTDYIHDGQYGGGQYLNACIWFEMLTKKSCVGTAFRPTYSMGEKETRIALLQQYAHQAVAAVYGEDYAK